MRKLTILDIVDHRAYERERETLRREVMELKKSRRVQLGPLMTVVFENATTVRWQIQEMVRVERMLTDDQIGNEVETYNELLPGPEELSATLFVELTSEDELREWLPRLVGVENSVEIVLSDASVVRGVDPHADRLSRTDVTAAVHFLKFSFTPAQKELFPIGPVRMVVDHEAYPVDVELSPVQHQALSEDFENTHEPSVTT